MSTGGNVQLVSTVTGAVATGTTVVPIDDTIPQNTEGDQYMTLAITPRASTNKLVIEVVWVGASSAAGNMTVALFQDSTAGALAAVNCKTNNAGDMLTIPLRHVMDAGTTSATTFKVRAGQNNAGTTTFNGHSGGRMFGGISASSIVIREIAV